MSKKILIKTSAVLASLALILGWSVLPAFAESGSSHGSDNGSSVTTSDSRSGDSGRMGSDTTSSDVSMSSETFGSGGEGATLSDSGSEGGSSEASLTSEGGDEGSTSESMNEGGTDESGVVSGDDGVMSSEFSEGSFDSE